MVSEWCLQRSSSQSPLLYVPLQIRSRKIARSSRDVRSSANTRPSTTTPKNHVTQVTLRSPPFPHSIPPLCARWCALHVDRTSCHDHDRQPPPDHSTLSCSPSNNLFVVASVCKVTGPYPSYPLAGLRICVRVRDVDAARVR